MTDLKIALITGANRGLGLETCRQLAAAGLTVILTARNEADGRTQAEALAGDVRFHPLDVADPASVQTLAEFVKREFGRLDVLVNNAGIFPDPFPGRDPGSNSIFDTDIEVVRQGLETNTLGLLRMCQTFIPLMQGRGRVVNISSGMGQLSDMNGCCPGYRLSKTAVNAITRIFADELRAAGSGVKINAICPGWVRTDMGGGSAALSTDQSAKGLIARFAALSMQTTGCFETWDGKPYPF